MKAGAAIRKETGNRRCRATGLLLLLFTAYPGDFPRAALPKAVYGRGDSTAAFRQFASEAEFAGMAGATAC